VPSWNELLVEFGQQPNDQAKLSWLDLRLTQALNAIGNIRGNRNVLLYSSAFLQKPQLPALTVSITHEDLNGFMSCIYGMDFQRGLTLLLHTPGGVTNAAETIVAYLRSKFDDLEIIVPTFAMSAGTMISLGSDRIVLGRQSQLGPIDPQLVIGSRSVSAQAVVDQFERARDDILGNRDMAHVWAPILPSLGPSLLVDARNALSYGETMVSGWLARWMFKDQPDRDARARRTAQHFNDAQTHMSHGRRIDRDEARSHGLTVEDLEASQPLQEEVLTAYHVMTITFEQSMVVKLMRSGVGRGWLKNHA
jgi:hypothetical protein